MSDRRWRTGSLGFGPTSPCPGRPGGCMWLCRVAHGLAGSDTWVVVRGQPSGSDLPLRQSGAAVLVGWGTMPLVRRSLESQSVRTPPSSAGRGLVRQSTSAATGIVPGSQQGPSDAYSEGPLLWFRLGVRVATVGERHAPRPRTPVARTTCAQFAAGGGHDDKWPNAPRCSSSVHVCVFGTLPHQREPYPRGRRCGVNFSPDLDALAPE